MEIQELMVSRETIATDAAILVIQVTGLHLELHTHEVGITIINVVYTTSRHSLNNGLARVTFECKDYQLVDDAS
ncbi:hypothetical protein PS631_01705 [Pseudomonas fluorescens]|uniref:Uncharacterized protein n=1 Tax=Pseudomonas fluorescens TaxID=294 RepID=A0A5E6RL78_PSEFL|nr:hypothetical protein PS631_01705 [Pseudomonas fluorescens]